MTIITDNLGEGEPAPLRAILIDPFERTVRPVDVPATARPCGCADADAMTLVELLGKHQQAYVVLDSETLVVGIGGSSTGWAWGSTPCSGFGLVLGGHYGHAFASSQASLGDVLDCVSWGPKRRPRIRTLETTDGTPS